MNSRSFALAGLSAAVLSGSGFLPVAVAAGSPQAYVLGRPGLAAPGTVTVARTAMSIPQGTIVLGGGENSAEGAIAETESLETETTVLAVDRFRSLLKKSESVSDVSIRGESHKFPGPPGPLVGVPLVCERGTDGKWSSVLESGAPFSDAQRASMKDSDPTLDLGNSMAIYGGEARRPGDKWEVDLSKVAIYAGMNKPKGTLTAEFVKVVEVAGKPCAEVRLVFDLTGISGGEAGLTIRTKGQSVIHRSLQDLIDLDSKIEGDTDVSGPNPQGVMLQIKGHEIIETTTTVAKS